MFFFFSSIFHFPSFYWYGFGLVKMVVTISNGVKARKYHHNQLNETVCCSAWRHNRRMNLVKIVEYLKRNWCSELLIPTKHLCESNESNELNGVPCFIHMRHATHYDVLPSETMCLHINWCLLKMKWLMNKTLMTHSCARD